MRRHPNLDAAVLLVALAVSCSAGASESPRFTARVHTPGSSTTTAFTLPGGTVWHDGPDACSLLREEELVPVTGFALNAVPHEGVSAEGRKVDVCLWEHDRLRSAGGFVRVSVLPPEENPETSAGLLAPVVRHPSPGESTWVGHADLEFGRGPNVAVVDIGEGGFAISVATFRDVRESEMLALAQAAASRWQTGADQPGSRTSTTSPAVGSG